MYHSITVADQIVENFAKLANQDLMAAQIVRYIKRYLNKNNISTVVTVEKNQSVDIGEIILSAFYDHDADENNEIPIELVLIIHPDTTTINWNVEKWNEFAFNLIDYLEHELIHQHQYRSRDFIPNRDYNSTHSDPKVKEAQRYLGNPDEIDAYSHSLSKEIIRKSQNFDRALRLIRSFSNTAITKDQAGRLLSPALYGYIKEFEFDNKHPVIKRLMKKTYQNIILQKRNSERLERIKKRNDEIEQKKKEIEEKKNIDKQQGLSYTAITEIK
jgi:hypothetical protein